MKKILIIGFGYWGSRIFNTLLNTCSKKYSITVFDTLSKHKNYYYKKKIEYFDDFKKIELSDFDYFIISTSVSSHLFFIEKLAKYKKPIFVEKTLTNNIKEFSKVEKLKNKYSLSIFTGYTYLYNSNIQKIKKIIKKIKNKDFLQIKFQRYNLGPIRKDTSVLNDLLSHDLAIFFYFFSVSNIKFHIQCLKFKMKNNIDSIFINFNFKYININFSASWLYPRKNRIISIVHKQGVIYFSENEKILHIRKFSKKFDYNKMLYNIDNFNQKENNLYLSSNSLQDELLIFLKQNKKEIEKNFKISKKVQTFIEKIKLL